MTNVFVILVIRMFLMFQLSQITGIIDLIAEGPEMANVTSRLYQKLRVTRRGDVSQSIHICRERERKFIQEGLEETRTLKR